MRNVESNPVRAVERSSIAATTVSWEDTTAISSPTVPLGRSLQRSKFAKKSKSRDSAPPSPKSKRSREGDEAEAPRKRTSQTSHPASAPKPDNTLALVKQASGARRLAGESSQDPPSYPWTKEGFKLPKTRRELENSSKKSKSWLLHLPIFFFQILRLESFLVEPHC